MAFFATDTEVYRPETQLEGDTMTMEHVFHVAIDISRLLYLR